MQAMTWRTSRLNRSICASHVDVNGTGHHVAPPTGRLRLAAAGTPESEHRACEGVRADATDHLCWKLTRSRP